MLVCESERLIFFSLTVFSLVLLACINYQLDCHVNVSSVPIELKHVGITH